MWVLQALPLPAGVDLGRVEVDEEKKVRDGGVEEEDDCGRDPVSRSTRSWQGGGPWSRAEVPHLVGVARLVLVV